MAYACQLLGKSCIVVMPTTSAQVKIEAVREYNTSLKTFPSVLWATFWFTGNEPFQNFTVPEDKIELPKVDFGTQQ